MENLKTTINVQVDKNNLELATKILNNLELSMSDYINMAIKELIIKNSIPFEIENPKPSKELLEALQEGEDILSGKIQAKGYHSVKELIEDLEN